MLATKIMAGKTFVPRSTYVSKKVKFTVSVRGHQWSSARHVNETLQEFARVIQKNARRLAFIGENDTIQRLQLAKIDGSELEELDVDATLEDVIICMGDKHLMAIITPAKFSMPCHDHSEVEKLGPTSPMVISSHQKPKPKKDVTNCYVLSTTPSTTLAVEETDLATVGIGTRVAPFKSNCEPLVRGLKITIPSSDSSPAVFHDNNDLFEQDFSNERQTTFVQQAIASRSSYYNCEMLGSNGLQGSVGSSISTPSPAELAHFLVRGSSMPLNRPPLGMNINNTCYSAGQPIAGFQAVGSGLLSRFPLMPSSNQASQVPMSNIAMLVQFLASQLQAFIPVTEAQSPSNSTPISHGGNKLKVSTTEVTPVAYKHDEMNCCPNGDKSSERSCSKDCRPNPDNELSKVTFGDVKLFANESHDKDDSSSSANVNTTAAPSNVDPESEKMHNKSELIFLVNRRSKTGVGTHHLKLSDLSAFFHLSVVDAAKKLGVSQTTLKKACRKFGLKRWPGRKVRSLESTIHGLEHTIAVGQGAGMEELTEAYMRSEVSKLQQEMNQLVHGTPVQQHSPMARTADLYKRLYSRGWRSKYHSSCGRFYLDLNMDSRDNEGITSFNQKKKAQEMKPVNTRLNFENGGVSLHNVETNGNMSKTSFCKDDSMSHISNEIADNTNDNASSLNKGVQPELLNTSAIDIMTDFTGNSNRSRNQKHLEELSVDVEVIDRGKDVSTERCPKRLKADVT